MSKLLKLLLILGILTVTTYPFVSCSDNDDKEMTPPDPDDPNDPNDPDDPDAELKPGDGGLGKDTPTPLTTATYLIAEGGNDGVTIEVTEVTHDNFIFNCRPGKYVKSYRMDVYPLATLFNYLYEGKKTRPEVSVEDLILEVMFSSQGNASYSFSISSLGENWERNEHSWKESRFAQGEIVPGSTYVIATVGCHDDQANEMADLKLCFLSTSTKELIGEPKVGIETKSAYTAVGVKYTPNADCHWYHQFCAETSQINEFISAYGEDMYHDFIRQIVASPIGARDETISHEMVIPFTNNDSKSGITASAIGLDINRTPGIYTSEEVFLKEIPAETESAQYTLNVVRIGATIIKIDVVADLSSHIIFYRRMNLSDWKRYENASEQSLEALKKEIAENGYGVDNRFSTTDDVLHEIYDYNLASETEYVILSIGRNEYMQFTDIVATEPFKTKKRVYDPEGSASKINVELSDPERTNFKATYSYNAETAMYYHQNIIDPTLIEAYEAGDPNPIVNYLLQPQGINYWEPKPRDQDGSYQWTWTGLKPAMKYTFAMMGEDWEGRLSAISLSSISTQTVQGGPNPAIEIHSSMTEDNSKWFVNFAIKEDVKTLYSLVDIDTYSIDPDFTYEDCLSYWLELVLGERSFKTVNSITMTKPIEEGVRYVALAVPFGEENGKDVRGELSIQLYDKSLGGIITQDQIKDKIWGAGKSLPTMATTNWIDELCPIVIHPDSRKKAIEYQSSKPVTPATISKNEQKRKDLLERKDVTFIDLFKLAKSPHGIIK